MTYVKRLEIDLKLAIIYGVLFHNTNKQDLLLWSISIQPKQHCPLTPARDQIKNRIYYKYH